jgi:hypothetical protein
MAALSLSVLLSVPFRVRLYGIYAYQPADYGLPLVGYSSLLNDSVDSAIYCRILTVAQFSALN